MIRHYMSHYYLFWGVIAFVHAGLLYHIAVSLHHIFGLLYDKENDGA